MKIKNVHVMAAIDKIYGTKEQWRELYDFLLQNKPQYLIYLYPQPETFGPISNFTHIADRWLWKHCSLEFVIEALKEQYSNGKLE